MKESEVNTPKVSSSQPIVSLKRVRAAVGDDEIVDIDLQGRRKRRKKAEVVEESLKEKRRKYRLHYSALGMRERKLRVNGLAEQVIAACIPAEFLNSTVCVFFEGE